MQSKCISEDGLTTPCNMCGKNPWPSNAPKPDCRIRVDIENCKNPVTISVYKEILHNREANGTMVPCPKEVTDDVRARPKRK